MENSTICAIFESNVASGWNVKSWWNVIFEDCLKWIRMNEGISKLSLNPFSMSEKCVILLLNLFLVKLRNVRNEAWIFHYSCYSFQPKLKIQMYKFLLLTVGQYFSNYRYKYIVGLFEFIFRKELMSFWKFIFSKNNNFKRRIEVRLDGRLSKVKQINENTNN